MPEAVAQVRAQAAGAAAVRVSWLAPAAPAGHLTHYTLYTRELGKYVFYHFTKPPPPPALIRVNRRRRV